MGKATGRTGKGMGRTGKGKGFTRRTAEELTPGHAMRQGKTSSFANPATAIIQARANAQIKEGLKDWKQIAVIALGVFAGLLLASGTGCL